MAYIFLIRNSNNINHIGIDRNRNFIAQSHTIGEMLSVPEIMYEYLAVM